MLHMIPVNDSLFQEYDTPLQGNIQEHLAISQLLNWPH